MSFSLPSFQRVPLKEQTSKDVNKEFKYGAEIGFGTYGRVYKAFSRQDSSIYALKKLIMHETSGPKADFLKEGFPITSLREIKFLQKLEHPNIIKLHDIVISSTGEGSKAKTGSTYLVFEYMDHDFLGFLLSKHEFSMPQIKCIMKQLLYGLQYMHEKGIIHRDLKTANILYNNRGEVKIADFGLARLDSKQGKYTNKVVTLWYRAPELLLGGQNYDSKIDMWSLGCFFAELLIKEILFKGDKEARQLQLIYEKCGSPDELSWPGVKSYPFYDTFGPQHWGYQPRSLIKWIRTKIKGNIDEIALDLLDKLLILFPERRLTAKEALEHDFFKVEPLACEISSMPKLENSEIHGVVKKNTPVDSSNPATKSTNPRQDLTKFENPAKKLKKI